MNFVLKPSLEHIALVKIVISLWNQNDVRTLISKLCCDDLNRQRKWKRIEERVIQKVKQLSLPHLLKEKVLGFIKPIGLEISKFLMFPYIHSNLQLNLPPEFYWTPQGTVDRKRTATVVMKDDSLDASARYKLACIYCLEEDIIQFWNSMSEDLIESVSYSGDIWSRIMRRRGSHISYKDAFCTCADKGNKVAAEYFLQKLTPTEREESLVATAKHASNADTLCFLLSEMTEEQQVEVFRLRPYDVLESFLHWPRQSFFIEIASFMWDFLSKNDYYNIWRDIIKKVVEGYKDYDYQMLFREFWQKSPTALKSLITNEIHTNGLLSFLFYLNNEENVRLILKDTPFTVKEKLIYSDEMIFLCERSIYDNKWDFLKFCIQECFPSKNDMLKFKKEYEKLMAPYYETYFAPIKPKWDLLFCFSDDSDNKRSLEEGESSSSKQFRSLQ